MSFPTLAQMSAALPHIAISYGRPDGASNPRADFRSLSGLPAPFAPDGYSSYPDSWRGIVLDWVRFGLASVEPDLHATAKRIRERVAAAQSVEALTATERAAYKAPDLARATAGSADAARAILAASLGGYAPASLLAELTPLVAAKRTADALAEARRAAIYAVAMGAHIAVRDKAIAAAVAKGHAAIAAENGDSPAPATRWGRR